MGKEEAQNSVVSIEEEARKLSSFKDSGKGPYLFQIPPPRLPEMNESIIKMSVIHIEDPNKFWCHRVDDVSTKLQANQPNQQQSFAMCQSVSAYSKGSVGDGSLLYGWTEPSLLPG